MTSRSEKRALAAQLKALDVAMDELLRLGRTGEALMGLADRLVNAADAVLRVQTVDQSNDLRPELEKTLALVVEASEQVKSMARVVDARFKNALGAD